MLFVELLKDGGAAAGAEAQLLFGSGPILRTSSPPPTISAWLIHVRESGLPLSVAD